MNPSKPSILLALALVSYENRKQSEPAAPALPTYITKLAVDFPERNTRHPEQLQAATDWIAQKLETHAPDSVTRQDYQAAGLKCSNIELSLTGKKQPDEIIVIGSHYDSVPGSPGANDNGSGIAALLYLAQHFSQQAPFEQTLRFVAFTNEEPPHFQTTKMGSIVYAKRCALKSESILAMLSLETMGDYTDAPKSQKYPPLVAALYPEASNFLAIVTNPDSKTLCATVKEHFQSHSALPIESAVFPPALFPQSGWSDHWAFWKERYPGLMITDTITCPSARRTSSTTQDSPRQSKASSA